MELTKIDNFNNSKISLNRKIVFWEWYKDTCTFKLFIHCLLRANFRDEKYCGIIVKRGQFITGRSKLAQETGLTEMQIRTAIKHLILTNEITIKSTKRYSIISINKYDVYQQNNQVNNQQITNRYPTDNQQVTTNNNDNNDNNDNKIERERIGNFEIKILTDFVKRQKRKIENIDAYIRKIIDNGDYKRIIKKEKARLERQKLNKANKKQQENNKKHEFSEQELKEIEKIQERIKNDLIRKRENEILGG